LELGLCLNPGFSRANDLIADAHRGDGKRFVVRADEKLSAFCGTRSGDPRAPAASCNVLGDVSHRLRTAKQMLMRQRAMEKNKLRAWHDGERATLRCAQYCSRTSRTATG